jgi:hypothetical protein
VFILSQRRPSGKKKRAMADLIMAAERARPGNAAAASAHSRNRLRLMPYFRNAIDESNQTR